MKTEFFQWLNKKMSENDRIIFLTADVGYQAVESIEKDFKSQFINVGVSEQNLIGVAAGLASQGFLPFCYSIAPFITLRAVEHIRNDICFHRFNVKLVGYGAGMAYGLMGPTHQTLEDIAIISSLPLMKCFMPIDNQDLFSTADSMIDYQGPSYLRMNHAPRPPGLKFSTAKSLSRLSYGDKLSIAVFGTLVPRVWSALKEASLLEQVSFFGFSELANSRDINQDAFFQSAQISKNVLTIEEHISRGGFNDGLARELLEMNWSGKFASINAEYPTRVPGGSHDYLLNSVGLSQDDIIRKIKKAIL